MTKRRMSSKKIESQLSKMSSKLKEMDIILVTKEKENNILKTQLEKTGSDSQVDLQQKSEEVSKLTIIVSEKQAVVESQQNQIESSKIKIDELITNIATSEKNIVTLSDIKTSLEKEVEALKDSTKNATGEVGRLMDAVATKETELERLHKEIKSLQTDSEKLKEAMQLSEEGHKAQLEAAKQETEDVTHAGKKENKKFEQ